MKFIIDRVPYLRYLLFQKIPRLPKKLLLSSFVYKYFPRLFLWVKFSVYGNKNTSEYWNTTYRKELSISSSHRFGEKIVSLLPKKLFEDALMLDVGCGTGQFLQFISNARLRVGVDISEIGLSTLDQKEIFAVSGALPSLPIRQKFDVVTCFETLEHVSDWQSSVLELVDLVSTEGYLLISVPFEMDIVISEHVNYFDVERLYKFLKPHIQVIEIKLIRPWILIVCKKAAGHMVDDLYFRHG